MRENVDLVAFNYRKVYSGHSEDIRNFVIAKEDTGVGCLEKMHPGLYLWDKIFKRSAIRERFIDNTYHIEDLYFNIINMIHLESVICLPVCGYESIAQINSANIASISKAQLGHINGVGIGIEASGSSHQRSRR